MKNGQRDIEMLTQPTLSITRRTIHQLAVLLAHFPRDVNQLNQLIYAFEAMH